jgi:hypothetical protein
MATRSRRRTQGGNEILGLIVSCVGGYAFLLGMTPTTATGTIGLGLLGLAIVLSIVHIIIGLKQGKQVFDLVIQLIVVCGITFALVYGCIWYFTVYLASQPDLFKFSKSLPTATP